MSVRSVPNDWEWRRLHERLDKAIAEAARDYMLKLAVRHISISVGDLSDELEELRLGREPDYTRPGFPLVYALKYMPRRVVDPVLGKGKLLMYEPGSQGPSEADSIVGRFGGSNRRAAGGTHRRQK